MSRCVTGTRTIVRFLIIHQMSHCSLRYIDWMTGWLESPTYIYSSLRSEIILNLVVLPAACVSLPAPPPPLLSLSVCLSVCFCFCLHPSALYPFPSVIPLTGQLQSSFWTCSSSCLFPSFHPLSRWINIYSTFHSLSVTKGCIYIVFLHAKTTTDIPPRSGQTWIVCFNSFRGCASTLAWYGFCIALWPRCCF